MLSSPFAPVVVRSLCFAGLASLATAQVDVAICAAANTASTACQFTDVHDKLVASGLFNTVDVINASTSTPTLQQLLAYDAVIVWSNTGFQNSTLLGDTLADYVDAGGGVVVGVFAVNYATTTLSIQGRWQTGYEVIADQSGSTSGTAATLGSVPLPAHPIMAGVTSFDGGSNSFRPTATVLTPGSIEIADWSDGRILVAQGLNPKRIDLGFYPPSSDCFSGFWVSSTDGEVLLANALYFSATAGLCGSVTNYCTPGTSSSGCSPVISGTGTPSASSGSGFTIDAADLEGQKQGLIFYGTNNSGFTPSPWGTSFFCVKPPTQRLPVASSAGTIGMCDGQISVDWNAFVATNPGVLGSPFSSGQHVYAQCWFRDPPSAKTTLFTDAIEFVVCP